MSRFVRVASWTIAVLICLSCAIRASGCIDAGRRRRFVRQFNKRILNPFAMWLVARRPMYYGVLRHKGRRSGKTYATPVVAKLTSAGVIIPLPYSANADWCRNVLVAGSCSLKLGGEEYALILPEVIPASIGEHLVPPTNASVWRRIGIEHYLLLRLAATEAVLEQQLAA